MMAQFSILFVCLGNICRSPTAEAVFRQRALQYPQLDLHIDSAGTGDWHHGDSPDKRSQSIGASRGYPMSDLRARQVRLQDFEQFDYIFAMDRSNLNHLEAMAPSNFRGELALLLEGANADVEEVPDPYYTRGDQGFHQVIDLIEEASERILDRLAKAS